MCHLSDANKQWDRPRKRTDSWKGEGDFYGDDSIYTELGIGINILTLIGDRPWHMPTDREHCLFGCVETYCTGALGGRAGKAASGQFI